MKTPETNTTDKSFEIEYTDADIQEMRESGYSEDELPTVGKHTFRRARHITPRHEQKIKITMYVDADILDFFKERAKEPNASPYQTQINNELRAVMNRKQTEVEDEVVTVSMLDNPAFISALAEKLKAA